MPLELENPQPRKREAVLKSIAELAKVYDSPMSDKIELREHLIGVLALDSIWLLKALIEYEVDFEEMEEKVAFYEAKVELVSPEIASHRLYSVTRDLQIEGVQLSDHPDTTFNKIRRRIGRLLAQIEGMERQLSQVEMNNAMRCDYTCPTCHPGT